MSIRHSCGNRWNCRSCEIRMWETLQKRFWLNSSEEGVHRLFDFSWEMLHQELKDKCPVLLSVISASIGNIPTGVQSKPLRHVMLSTAMALHGRSQEMSVVQYITSFILLHGGCTQRVSKKLILLFKIWICLKLS